MAVQGREHLGHPDNEGRPVFLRQIAIALTLKSAAYRHFARMRCAVRADTPGRPLRFDWRIKVCT
jgi:hypothetical protein